MAGNNSCYEIEDRSFWFKNRNSIISEGVKKQSIDSPIFDVGGGNGFVSNYLDTLGFETVLVEPGIDGCLNGKGKGLKNIINSNFDTTHFYPNSIPNIGIFDVLEHVENQHQFLKTICTNMIPDGRLFITVPAFQSLWSEEDNQAGHYRRYRNKELRELIENYGFELLYDLYFYSFLVIPIFIFRTIPSMFGIYNTSSQQSKSQHLSNSNANKILYLTMKLELNLVKRVSRFFFVSVYY